jgi:hypothetical protein
VDREIIDTAPNARDYTSVLGRCRGCADVDVKKITKCPFCCVKPLQTLLFMEMRTIAIILASLVGPIGGLPISPPSSSSEQPSESCCCCASRTVCRCGCAVPADDRSPSGPQEPRRLNCSCDAAPLGPLPAGYHTPVPRVIGMLASDDFASAHDMTRIMTEVRADAQGPPPDLPFLRTIVLIA